MKNYLYYVGIDVSKMKLDVTFLNSQTDRHTHIVIGNNPKGLKELSQRIKKLNIDSEKVLISFEDTGVYSLPLCCFFAETGQDYWMIPAIEIKRSKGLVRGKSDKSDSKDIAFYSKTHRHKLKLGTLPEKALMELRLLFAEREKIVKAVKQFRTTSENIGYLPKDVLKNTLKINALTLKTLEQNLVAIDERMQLILKENEPLRQQNELIQSIPGIGIQTAIYLILATKAFQRFDHWRQLASYAGVAPFEYTSGSSIRGRTKVSPYADKKLKSLLNMCAMNAKKCDADLKLYYERKLEEGKSKMLVLNNIRAKLLGRVFAVINRGTAYVNTKKFAT